MESYILHCSSWPSECDSAKMLDNDTNEIKRENKNCHSQLSLNVLLLHILVFLEIHREAIKKILERRMFMYDPLAENLMGCM